MKSDDIKQNNRTDITVATIKSIAGPIPFIGPMIQEMVDVIIPNQRIDRLSKYVLELEQKLTRFEQGKIEDKLKNEYFVDLMEESLVQASKALTNERLEYISSIIENSLDKEHIIDIENKHLLTLLKEINDIEIIWLRSYLVPTIGGDVEFREKHKDVLETIIPTLGSTQEERDKAAIQNSYKEHLSTLGLLEKKSYIYIYLH